jgi:protein-L-isoaspartate(D-aspartate) O-methyltransferase
MNVEQARFNMIEQQIRPWDVLDTSVLTLLSLVKREDFVPLACRNIAFTDMELPLGEGQFMLAPRVQARLLQDLGVHKHEKVLEIGTGSGFLTALLAHKAQQVVSLEIYPAIAEIAKNNLRQAGIFNAEVRQADGSQYPIANGPFDAILLSGSVLEVPEQLLMQLKRGGRLIAIVGQEPMMVAQLITKMGDHQFRTQNLFDTVVPKLIGFGQPSKFKF